MLTFISGHIDHVQALNPQPWTAFSGNAHDITLCAGSEHDQPGAALKFRVDGRVAVQLDDQVVVMLYENRVVGLHNHTARQQVNYLREVGTCLWRRMDFVQGLVLGLATGSVLGLLAGMAAMLAWVATSMALRAYGSWTSLGDVDDAFEEILQGAVQPR